MGPIGFRGFKTVTYLKEKDWKRIPDHKGVYIVMHGDPKPDFLEKSVGGHFKGKDPTISLDTLRKKWVDGAKILYIGQTGSNSEGTLKERIKTLIEFGQSKPVGHWGGRYLWQLSYHQGLKISWMEIKGDPLEVENALLSEFEILYGRLPFANLRKGKK